MRRTARHLVILASPLLLVSPPSLKAQTSPTAGERPVKLGGSLGAVVPFGDFGDIASVGFHLTALLELARPSLPVGLRTEVMYQRYGLNSDLAQLDDAHGTVWGFIGNLTFPLGDTTSASSGHPYLIGGVGIYRSKASGKFAGR